MAESQPQPPFSSSTSLATRYRLDQTIAELSLHPDDQALRRLEVFIRLLLKWNRTYNLSGARDEKSLVQDHLVDCLAIVPIIKTRIDSDIQEGNEPLLVDVGSGAGFPGLIIAAMSPDWPIALVEPVSKKVAFLQQAVASMKLPNVRPIGLRLEQSLPQLTSASPDRQRSTWHFTSRAVASLADLVSLVSPLARANSRLFAMRSEDADNTLPDYRVSTHLVKAPGSAKTRTLAEVALCPGSAQATVTPASPR